MVIMKATIDKIEITNLFNPAKSVEKDAIIDTFMVRRIKGCIIAVLHQYNKVIDYE